MSKYSIILPVRNGGTYFKKCVSSILNQSVNDLDLLILDNCSNDGSIEWVNTLGDDRIKVYYSDKPLSIEESWKRIAGIPKGEFSTLIGHDDILLPGYLEEMDRLINKHPDATLYQTHFNYIDEQGDKLYPCKDMDEIQNISAFIQSQLTRSIDSTGTGYMFRSKQYAEVGGISSEYPNLIFADYELWVKLTSLGYKATSVKTCFEYRIHNSVSKLTNGDQYQQAFEKYVQYLIATGKKDTSVREVLNKYGGDYLMYYCEALSHRLLKTPASVRNITVPGFIQKCKQLALEFIPGREFKPFTKPGILLAWILDQNGFGRTLFLFYQRIKS